MSYSGSAARVVAVLALLHHRVNSVLKTEDIQ